MSLRKFFHITIKRIFYHFISLGIFLRHCCQFQFFIVGVYETFINRSILDIFLFDNTPYLFFLID